MAGEYVGIDAWNWENGKTLFKHVTLVSLKKGLITKCMCMYSSIKTKNVQKKLTTHTIN